MADCCRQLPDGYDNPEQLFRLNLGPSPASVPVMVPVYRSYFLKGILSRD